MIFALLLSLLHLSNLTYIINYNQVAKNHYEQSLTKQLNSHIATLSLVSATTILLAQALLYSNYTHEC